MAKCNCTPEHCSSQEKLLFTRKLKVREGYYSYKFDPYYRRPSSFRAPVPVPWIYIKGYWLNQAGFTIGTHLSVEVQEGCIVIKPRETLQE